MEAVGSGATYYQLEIDELVSDGMAVKRAPVVVLRGPSPHFDLPPWFFSSGGTYTITAGATLGGYAAATTGDLATFALPLAVAQIDSGVFTVVAK
jgi:hypothetical protein